VFVASWIVKHALQKIVVSAIGVVTHPTRTNASRGNISSYFEVNKFFYLFFKA